MYLKSTTALALFFISAAVTATDLPLSVDWTVGASDRKNQSTIAVSQLALTWELSSRVALEAWISRSPSRTLPEPATVTDYYSDERSTRNNGLGVRYQIMEKSETWQPYLRAGWMRSHYIDQFKWGYFQLSSHNRYVADSPYLGVGVRKSLSAEFGWSVELLYLPVAETDFGVQQVQLLTGVSWRL